MADWAVVDSDLAENEAKTFVVDFVVMVVVVVVVVLNDVDVLDDDVLH